MPELATPEVAMPDYYVYVYVDPRNFEEFYVGKGCKNRKEAHGKDIENSAKTRRIASIRADGQTPIVRVIARGLTEDQALLVEKTLLWRRGRGLTNQSSGTFAEKFRPHDTMHLNLANFDYIGGVYYFNVGEGEHRSWADFRQFGFISAGHGRLWREAICSFQEDDLVIAYLKHKGFVGIGRVTHRAAPMRVVTINGVPLAQHSLTCRNMRANIESDELCEYVALVEWERAVESSEAKWKPKSKLFTTQLVRASLANQLTTLRYLEKHFDVKFEELQKFRPV